MLVLFWGGCGIAAHFFGGASFAGASHGCAGEPQQRCADEAADVRSDEVAEVRSDEAEEVRSDEVGKFFLALLRCYTWVYKLRGGVGCSSLLALFALDLVFISRVARRVARTAARTTARTTSRGLARGGALRLVLLTGHYNSLPGWHAYE